MENTRTKNFYFFKEEGVTDAPFIFLTKDRAVKNEERYVLAALSVKEAKEVYEFLSNHKGEWEEKHVYHVETVPVWSSRLVAEQILERLYDTIELYNVLAVSDLYDYIQYFEPTFEYVPKYTDNKYGWTKTNQLRIVRKREGYTIGYDDPKLLE